MSERNPIVTCAYCGVTFESAVSIAEAAAESREVWGKLADEPQVAICNICYERLLENMHKAAIKYDERP